MAIDRTNFNAWVDDDGSGTTGTVLTKARMDDDILDPIDAELALKIETTDPRLSDERDPTAHAPTHNTGGDDAITALAGEVITSGTINAARLPATAATKPIPVSDISPVTGPSVLGRSSSSGAAETLPLGRGLAVDAGSLVATARASGVFLYGFSTTLTAPPGNGTVRFNAAHPYTAATKVWAYFVDAQSEDLYWGWMRITIGSYLLVQDKDDHTKYAEFTVTGAPIDNGTYVEVPVVWKANGTALAAQDVLVRLTTVSSSLGSLPAHATTHRAGGTDALTVVQTTTATGTQNDLSLTGRDTILVCNNASALTITGLTVGGAAPSDGDRVTLYSKNAQVNFAHQNSGSTATSRLVNLVTSGATPILLGSATYIYDGAASRWQLVQHEQGQWISVAFNAGDYTASGSMTWTVASGDVSTYAYRLDGRTLTLAHDLTTTTIGGTPGTDLYIAWPNGWTAALQVQVVVRVEVAGTIGSGRFIAVAGTSRTLIRAGLSSPNWVAGTDNTGANGMISVPLT